jgi:Protein of unknown function (DUF2637)
MKKSSPPLTPDERVSALIRSFIWLIVFPAALFLSGWSLYWLMRHWGAPPFVAVFASACTDGVAIYAADQCLSAIQEGSRGTWERVIVFVFALAGAWINRYHAIALGEPLPAQVGWAIPTLAAAVVYDLKHRKTRRKYRQKQYERTGQAYPDLGTWLFFPFKSLAWSMDYAWSSVPARTARHWWERDQAVVKPEIAPKRPLITLSAGPNLELNDVNTEPYPVTNTNKPNPANRPNPKPANVTNLTGRPKPSDVRAWAKANGWPDLADRARLPRDCWEAYYNAHSHRLEDSGL